jgi:hypothetical protein
MMGKGHDPIEEGSWRQQRAVMPPRCTPSANFGVENNANNGHDQHSARRLLTVFVIGRLEAVTQPSVTLVLVRVH